MDLKTMLEERAEEMRLEPRIPASVLGRVRRRRAIAAALTGALTVGLALGAFVGARALLDQTGSGPTELRPGGTTEEFYPFIYPPTQEELDTTLAEVADGSMPMWTDPEGAAILFAANVMGWELEDVQASVRGDEPITVVITNPALNDAAAATSDLRTVVYLARAPGSDDPLMYAVLAADAEPFDVVPTDPEENLSGGRSLSLTGQVSALPDEGVVMFTFQDGRGSSEGHWDIGPSFPVRSDGTFELTLRSHAPLRPETLLTLTLLGGSGQTLAMTSSRMATPVVGGTETGGSEPQVALPPPVAATRDSILDASRARDWEALRALIPAEGFTFSFGGETDPIRYWKRLESDGHSPVIGDILPSVLDTNPGFQRGVSVWPAQATEKPARWDEADIEALTAIHAEEDIRAFQEAGLYYGWRVGIDRDGTWVFFVSGD